MSTQEEASIPTDREFNLYSQLQKSLNKAISAIKKHELLIAELQNFSSKQDLIIKRITALEELTSIQTPFLERVMVTSRYPFLDKTVIRKLYEEGYLTRYGGPGKFYYLSSEVDSIVKKYFKSKVSKSNLQFTVNKNIRV